MKNKAHANPRRVELGRASLATQGNVFGTIEQVGLYERGTSLSGR